MLRKQRIGTTYPSVGGPFKVGDLLWNDDPAAARPLGWVCTVAGSPGTWEPFGDIGELWDDLRISADTGKVPAANYPDWEAYKTNVGLYAFDKNTDQSIYFCIQMPHGWKEGSAVYPHVHWIPKTNGAAGPTRVCWAMDYTWANIGGTFGATATVYGNVPTVDEVLVADRHYQTALNDSSGNAFIGATGKTISSMLICRVYRDANGTSATDDYDDDAYLLEFDLHYQLDASGSASRSVK